MIVKYINKITLIILHFFFLFFFNFGVYSGEITLHMLFALTKLSLWLFLGLLFQPESSRTATTKKARGEGGGGELLPCPPPSIINLNGKSDQKGI